jgi:nicotinamidase/pyrazinamidase
VAGYDARTALIVVDVQNDFADPDGSLFVTGAPEIMDTINAEIERAAEAGALICYTQDWHPPDTPHFAKDGGDWPVHCVSDSWGAELHPDMVVRGEVVHKGSEGEDGYSGFSVRDPATGEVGPTRLESILRDRGVQEVVIVGFATDYCVRETALDALRLGFRTTVPAAAVRAVDLQSGDGDRALAEIEDAEGVVER